jgi:hypothetical protein
MPAEPLDEVPAPRGPGAVPPFTAPPTDRDSRTLWIGLGVSTLLLAVCCVGGLVGVGVLFAGGVQEARAQAQDVVGNYLGALEHRDYRGAYQLLCTDLTRSESLSAFTRRVTQDPVRDFTVGAATETDSELVVAAEVRFERQGLQQREYLIEAPYGEMQICGER